MGNWRDYIRGKKVTVMGLGLLGRGVGDAKFLAEEGAHLIVTDLKTGEQLRSSIDELKGFKNIQFVLGEHRLEDFRNRDFILKAAGVPLDSPYIAEARKNNIPIEMSSALFAAFTPATVVGITGTRGKTTVTQLMYEILCKAYASPLSPSPGQERGRGEVVKKPKIFLGGNVHGVSTLPFVRETQEGDIAVLELDSWQLQGFGERNISPRVSVFTTFFPDHLNYYKGDVARYFADKAYIFVNHTEHDVLVISKDVFESPFFQPYTSAVKSKIVVVEAREIPEEWQSNLPGEHNKFNSALARAAARALGVDDKTIKTAIENFKPVSGRLEYLKTVNGIKIYNDNNATTPDATIAALKALDNDNRNIILVFGGTDKNLDMSGLVKEIGARAKAAVFFKETGTDKIKPDLEKLREVKIIETETFEESITTAFSLCKSGDTLLFSPAFASFGRFFKNEYERNDQFVSIINTWK